MDGQPETNPETVILGEGKFIHTCLRCKVVFRDTARNTRFCTKLTPEKECQKKYQEARRKRKKEYTDNAPYYRVKSMCHSLAQAVLAMEVAAGRRLQCCEMCWSSQTETVLQQPIEMLEVHHRNVNIFDNRPENLSYLCKKHHIEEQSFLRLTDDTKRWYILPPGSYRDQEAKQEGVVGPWEYNRVLKALQAESINPNTLVSRNSKNLESSDWKPVFEHKEFDLTNQFVRERILMLKQQRDAKQLAEYKNDLEVIAAAKNMDVPYVAKNGYSPFEDSPEEHDSIAGD